MPHIKIIGAGQLGSRHLQALKSIETPLLIEVVDPSLPSLEIAKQRYDSLTVSGGKHELVYSQQIQHKQPVDIAIVATGAAVRRAALNALLDATIVKYLVLEKLLFTRPEDYTTFADQLAQLSNTKAWVNCCMRMMPFYQKLKTLIGQQAIHYTVTGSQYGLVTNAIHYLDHLAYLTGCNEFSIDTQYLDMKPIASKRSGYLELTGTLLARFADGSIANLTCYADGNMPVQIEINNPQLRVISREWQQLAWIVEQKTDWVWQEQSARIPYQSEMTTQLIHNLLKDGRCDLVEYAESVKIHLQLLEPLRLFLQQQNIQPSESYPFT